MKMFLLKFDNHFPHFDPEEHSIEFNNLFILKYIFKNKKYGISGKNLEASFINMA